MTNELEIHEQEGYFLIICDKCGNFIKGNSEKHALANIKIHQESKPCEKRAREMKLMGGNSGGHYTPKEKK